MAENSTKTPRQRGSIRPRGDAFEVRVYAGKHPDTGAPVYHTETARDRKEAERARTRMLAEVDAGKAALTTDKFEVGVRRYLTACEAQSKAGELSEDSYKQKVQLSRDHIFPTIGALSIKQLDRRLAAAAERLYDELRACRLRCRGRIETEHHAAGQGNNQVLTDMTGHQCNKRCKPHVCQGASAALIIKVHAIISGTCKLMYRWSWISTNPADRILRPTPPKPNPQAPTTTDMSRLINAAFEEDADWGVANWMMMVTTGRRAEICRLQVKHINFDHARAFVPSTKVDGTGRWVDLDPVTMTILDLQVRRIAHRRAAAGLRMTGEEYLYSYEPAHETHGSLGYFTHRFTAMADRLGIDATPKRVRNYGAAELIANGVDIVSAARRLGHTRPSTTSDVYAAWRREADSRSSQIITAGIELPAQLEAARAQRDYSAEQPNRTSPELEERICALRRRTGWGAKRIREHLAAEEITVAESTIWKVLKRKGLSEEAAS